MEIAHGHINVTLSDQEAISGLRNVDREFDRTMRKIDAKEAEASVGADLSQLRKDLKQAEALIKDWERKVADARTKGQKRYRTSQLEAARADAQLLRNAVGQEGERLVALKQQNKQRDLAASKEKALEAASQRQVRIQQRLLKEKDRSLEMSRKEVLEAAKLQQTYSKLQQQLTKLDHARKGMLRRFDKPAQIRLRIETRDINARIEETRRRLIELNETPIEIPRDVDRGRLAKWGADLAQMTVRIGPFTTTIAQLGRVMLLLGPIIAGLVGALGAVTGALGAGLVGAVGAGAAALTGFGLAAAGIFLIAKPLVAEFTNIRKASEAYAKAVREHGEGSDKAAKKLKILHSVMGHVDDRTVEQFKLLGGLSDRWKRLTSAARPEFFRLVGDGIQTVSDMMPMFARNSVVAFRRVSAGIREWMAGLRSAEGQRIIDNIFGRFNSMIPSLMRGLGHLGTAIGRVFESFSRNFRGLGQGFEAWAKGLADATGRTGNLNRGVDKLVDSMRLAGRFIAAAGRVLIQFFRGGLAPGVGAVDSMTDSMNSLADSMATVEGQKGLRKFFEDSINTSARFFAALKPVLELFFEFITIMRPFTDVALRVAQALGNVVQALANFGPSRAIIQALVAVWTAWSIAKILGIAGAITRVGQALKALALGQGALAALSALFAGTALKGGAAAGGGIVGTLGKIGASAGGAAAAAKVIQSLGTAFLRILGPAGLAASAALIFGGNAETAATKANRLARSSEDLSTRITASSRSLAGSYTNLATQTTNLNDVNIEIERSQRRLNALQAHGKTNTDAYRQTMAGLTTLYAQRSAAEQSLAGSMRNITRAQDDVAASGFAVVDAQKAYATAVGDVNNHVDKQDDGYKRLIERYGTLENAPLPYLQQLKALQGHEDDLASTLDAASGAYSRLSDAQRQQRDLMARAALEGVNYLRAVQGMVPVAASAAASIQRLNRSLGTRTVGKIALKFPDPRDAARAMQAIDVAIRNGVSRRRAVKIILDSKDAETGIAKLRAAVLGIPTKTVNIVEKGGDAAVAKLREIKGTRLTPHEVKIGERGGKAALGLLNKLQATRIGGKTVGVSVRDAASGVMRGIKGMIDSLHDKTVTITTRHRSVGGIGARAAGGPISPEEKLVNRAASRAESRATKNVTGGGIFNRPTFLVGEEDRSEIVIATNPKYRQRNLGFLGMAARALGANATLPDGTVLAAAGFAGSGYYAPEVLPNAPGRPRRAGKTPRRPRAQRRRQRRVYRSQNAWHAHIASLKTQQDDWEREASIRQSAVQEPDDFIKEIGRTPKVVDPDTGAESGNEPIYAVDEAAVTEFNKQLQAVKDAYDRLVAITAAIVDAVPKAITANNAEIAVRRENVTAIKRAISADRPRERSKNEDVRKAAQRRIRINEGRLSREEAAIDLLKDDNKQLPEDRKDAGFDFREATLESQDLARQMGGTAGRAGEEAAGANPQPTTGGGGAGGAGGGPAAGLSPDQQAQLDQVGRLKEIVARGVYLESAAAQVFGQTGGGGLGAASRAGFAGGVQAASVFGGSRGSGGVSAGGAGTVFSARTGRPVGGAGVAGASGGNTFIINTLHPGDPATLDAIGQAATSGQSLQGSVVSPRERLGA